MTVSFGSFLYFRGDSDLVYSRVSIVLGQVCLGARPAFAQTPATGEIRGRVINKATGDYLRNAVVTVGEKDRLMFDVNADYRISKNLQVFVNGRNITNAPAVTYTFKQDLYTRKAWFGALWSAGIKGNF